MMPSDNNPLKIIKIQNPSAKVLFPEEEYDKILQNLCFVIDEDRFITEQGLFKQVSKLPDGRRVTKTGKVFTKDEVIADSPWQYYREAARVGKVSFVDPLNESTNKLIEMFNQDLLDKIKASGLPVVLPDVRYFIEEYQRALSLPDDQFRKVMARNSMELWKAMEYSVERNNESLAAINNPNFNKHKT